MFVTCKNLISYNTIMSSFLRSFPTNMKQTILQLLKNKYLYESRVRNKYGSKPTYYNHGAKIRTFCITPM